MSLSRLIKFFLNPNSYSTISKTDDGSVECTLNKKFYTRPGLVEMGISSSNIFFQDTKYGKISFSSVEEVSKVKFPFLGQIIVCVLTCLTLTLNSSKSQIISEFSNIFELFSSVMEEKSLSLSRIININKNKRSKMGSFKKFIYLKFIDVTLNSDALQKADPSDVKSLNDSMKRIKYQKMVRDKVTWNCQYIVTEQDNFIHQQYSSYKSEVISEGMVKIHLNKVMDESTVHLTQITNVNSCALVLMRKLIEETKETMNARGSDFINELSDMIEVFFTLLNVFDIKFVDILTNLNSLKTKFGSINVSVKKVVFKEK